MGTAEPFPSSSQCLSLVSAPLQEICSFPGEAETALVLVRAAVLGRVSVPGCVSVPALAQLNLCSVGEMLEMWMPGVGAVMLTWSGDLLQGPPRLLGAGTCLHGLCLGGTCCRPPHHHLPEAMSGTNKWERYRYPHRYANRRVLFSQPYPSPVGITLSPCPAGLGGGRAPQV